MIANDIDGIVRILGEKSSFILACHENPEGDAIGSELALATALRKRGKTVVVLNADPVPDNLRFLPGADTIVREADGSLFDVAVILDCAEPERTGRVLPELMKPPVLINIDHHRTNAAKGHFSLIDPEAPAAGILVHRILDRAGWEIDLDVALNIYVSVLTDTGSFHYGSTTPEAFFVAGEMLKRGIDPWDVAEKVYETQSFDRLKLLGRALSSLELSPSSKVAAITTTNDDMVACNATKDFLEGFINHPRSIAGVEVAVSFREEADGSVRLSFRSKGRVDVSAVAGLFGGGGHRNAAGGKLPGPMCDAKAKVMAALDEALSL